MPSSDSHPSSLFSPAARLLLDTPPQLVFDQFTRLTAKIFGVPVSLISVIDRDRQFFKSSIGLPEPLDSVRETPLTHSFCLHVVSRDCVVAVPDSRESEVFRENPSVEELGVIAYAGAPVRDAEGQPFAALCAIDSRPRHWSPAELEILEMLAAQVTREVVLRENLERLGMDASIMRAREETRERIIRADRHDLRTPLGALILSIDAVRELGALNREQSEFLQTAENSAETIINMVDSLIDIGSVDSRGGDALTLRPAEIGQLVEAARHQIAPLARQKKIGLSTAVDESFFLLDGPKLIRVLVNLLANSIKFTPEGGTVRLVADFVRDPSSDDSGFLRIAVSDTGVGIAREHLDLIFTEGFRVDETAHTRRSTGIGLTFCKKIVEAHGGTIGVRSAPGQGTVFTITLPARPNTF